MGCHDTDNKEDNTFPPHSMTTDCRHYSPHLTFFNNGFRAVKWEGTYKQRSELVLGKKMTYVYHAIQHGYARQTRPIILPNINHDVAYPVTSLRQNSTPLGSNFAYINRTILSIMGRNLLVILAMAGRLVSEPFWGVIGHRCVQLGSSHETIHKYNIYNRYLGW